MTQWSKLSAALSVHIVRGRRDLTTAFSRSSRFAIIEYNFANDTIGNFKKVENMFIVLQRGGTLSII